jgi:hypothetical protein
MLSWFAACKQFSPKLSKKAQDSTAVTIDSQPPASTKPKEIPNVNFDMTGFVNDNNYKIQYEISGFLNGDSYKDKVFVLQEYNEGGVYNPRLTMVLLGNKAGFWLYSQSNTILPVEYSTETDKKLFDTETLKIEEGKLIFELYSQGPNGHVYYDYAWNNDKLTLHELTATFTGAGSHTAITYLAQTETEGTVKETNVNTMDEDALPESTKHAAKLKCPTSFENFKYDRCLQEIMQ